jgi:hypothetical protein
LFSRFFGGPAYQSNNQLVVPKGATSPSQINWGSNDSSADFFRADQAMRQMQKQQQDQQATDSGTQPQGQKRGGAVKEPKHDPIHHALSIISHLLGHQHHAK